MDGPFAAAACAGWLAVDLSGALHRPPLPSPQLAGRPAPPAKVERLSGQVYLAPAVGREARLLSAGDDVPAGAVLESASGARAAVRLKGGGSLRLDAGTRLRLVSADQLALERGAVYVDAEPGRTPAAVTVHTRFGSVREQGTQFEVRLAAGALRVRVREGRIGLQHQTGAEEASPGEELRLQDGRVSRQAVAVHGPEWGWVQQIAPAFELEGESLGRFLAWVSRETGRPVRLADEDGMRDSGTSTRLHGSIAGLTPEEALSAVLPTCGRTHWYSRGAILVGRSAPGGGTAGRGVR